MSAPIAVTGGAGFIGSHLVTALVRAGHRVRVLDDLSTGRVSNLDDARRLAPEGVELIAGDVRDAAACAALCRGASAVFHLAAVASVPGSLADPARTIDVNVAGGARLLDAARAAGVARVVYASSSAVYGDATAVPAREGEEGSPLSPYALSKRMLEDLAAVATRCFGGQLVGLRFFNVYGTRQAPAGGYAAVVPALAAAWRAGEAPTIYGDGEQTRDFVHVDDAVVALRLAAGAPAAACGRAFNVGGGAAVSINQLAERLRRLLGSDLPPPRHAPARAGEVRHSRADLTAVMAGLGFRPAVGLEEGLARTL